MDMKAGRDLDALIAEKMMGVDPQVFTDPTVHWEINVSVVPAYSTDITAAWEVMEKLRGTRRDLFMLEDDGKRWRCGWGWGFWLQDDWTYEYEIESHADTAPHAICLAALKIITP